MTPEDKIEIINIIRQIEDKYTEMKKKKETVFCLEWIQFRKRVVDKIKNLFQTNPSCIISYKHLYWFFILTESCLAPNVTRIQKALMKAKRERAKKATLGFKRMNYPISDVNRLAVKTYVGV